MILRGFLESHSSFGASKGNQQRTAQLDSLDFPSKIRCKFWYYSHSRFGHDIRDNSRELFVLHFRRWVSAYSVASRPRRQHCRGEGPETLFTRDGWTRFGEQRSFQISIHREYPHIEPPLHDSDESLRVFVRAGLDSSALELTGHFDREILSFLWTWSFCAVSRQILERGGNSSWLARHSKAVHDRRAG